jgi:hypothetical protein
MMNDNVSEGNMKAIRQTVGHMNWSSVLVLLAFVFSISSFSISFAEDAGDPVSGSASTGGEKKKKSTDVSFDDVLVQGKYHFSDEAVTTVEDDKILDALLGVRTDFKDRIKKSTARR